MPYVVLTNAVRIGLRSLAARIPHVWPPDRNQGRAGSGRITSTYPIFETKQKRNPPTMKNSTGVEGRGKFSIGRNMAALVRLRERLRQAVVRGCL
ncbi:hypothetical protein CEXT_469961 [Caerostris extrusa]|uniref:Uncharacterized protein n=1 Tax=Caerostris extrusa TaxID=172846 RepID=A0AAV4XZ66_CAEEX|nr:hypothetical protein CEXT_469961 [Caerostris extrusa]